VLQRQPPDDGGEPAPDPDLAGGQAAEPVAPADRDHAEPPDLPGRHRRFPGEPGPAVIPHLDEVAHQAPERRPEAVRHLGSAHGHDSVQQVAGIGRIRAPGGLQAKAGAALAHPQRNADAVRVQLLQQPVEPAELPVPVSRVRAAMKMRVDPGEPQPGQLGERADKPQALFGVGAEALQSHVNLGEDAQRRLAVARGGSEFPGRVLVGHRAQQVQPAQLGDGLAGRQDTAVEQDRSGQSGPPDAGCVRRVGQRQAVRSPGQHRLGHRGQAESVPVALHRGEQRSGRAEQILDYPGIGRNRVKVNLGRIRPVDTHPVVRRRWNPRLML
jgi:hypothetical protein